MRLTGSTGITHRARLTVLAGLFIFGTPAAVSNDISGPPRDHRENLPPVGASLFDRLLVTPSGDGSRHDVPYPFERLIALLTERLAPEDGARGRSFSTTLIPYGRSLQREAARPEFFRYPRIVLAVDGQPGIRLPARDRLFIGYQEKARQIEIISYNEELGRFEFQVVENYADGETPVVRYASRALCMSCHQNATAIFPRRDWEETSSSRRVAERIGAFHRHYHGVAASSTSSEAGRIDSATNRANLFPVYQRIWREGCWLPNDEAGSLRCRAGAFRAMLRYRLGSWKLDLADEDGAYVRAITANWNRLWPDGLAVPDADLPDRALAPRPIPVELPPRLDPLSLRPPGSYWEAGRDVGRATRGMADTFLLASDMERLDRALHRRSRDSLEYRAGDCRVDRSSETRGNRWIGLSCSGRGSGIELVGELHVDESGRVNEGLSWLYLGTRGGLAYASLPGEVRPAAGGARAARLSLYKRYGNIRARMPDGAAMTRMVLTWTGAAGRFELGLSRDFDQVERAVAGLLRRAEAGDFDGFDDRALHGVRLMNALFDELGVDYPPAPPSESTLPGIGSPADAQAASSLHGAGSPLGVLQRHCGACHRSQSRFPPAFLSGSPAKVAANVESCAQRIAYRLGMWDRPEQTRPVTPMPPAAYLDTASIDAARWAASDDLRTLKRYLAKLAPASEDASPPTDYAGLPPCLPDAYGRGD